MSLSVSWVILTWNRASVVEESVTNNLIKAGRRPDEIIWVDNGSHEGDAAIMAGLFHDKVGVDVAIMNRENLGVSKGYNRGLVMATKELIVITGCDRLMPDLWCRRMVQAFEKIPEMACVSCYSAEEKGIDDRYLNKRKVEKRNEVEYIEALPFEARMIQRQMLKKVGYFREDFGLYGYEDCVWGPRMRDVAKAEGKIVCTFPDFKAVHLGAYQHPGQSEREHKEYLDWKKKENEQDWKWQKVKELADAGYPYYTPYV